MIVKSSDDLELMRVEDNGSISLGTASVTAAVKTTGTAQVTQLQDVATSGAPFVMVSDAMGNIQKIGAGTTSPTDKMLLYDVSESKWTVSPMQTLTETDPVWTADKPNYYTKTELNTNDGTINETTDPVSWYKLKNIPPGFADGIDNVNDADASTSNELQSLSSAKNGVNVTVHITSGTGTTFSVADKDNSKTNETPLSGTGINVSGRTVNLTNTDVTPDTYYSADITVDAQGRLTSAQNGAFNRLGGKIYRSTNQNFSGPANTIVKVDLTDIEWQKGIMYNATFDCFRVPESGYYLGSATVTGRNIECGKYLCSYISKAANRADLTNANFIVGQSSISYSDSDSWHNVTHVSAAFYANANDYVALACNSNDTSYNTYNVYAKVNNTLALFFLGP
ncbi:hypothetical protein JXO59_14650 [candidate division KSB1 bacterium]|nr:hypothetical protein [candidate division KSB1 bacterium]